MPALDGFLTHAASPLPALEVTLPAAPTPEHVWIDTYAALEEHLPRLLAAPRVGLDTETTGLSVWEDRLCLVQLAAPGQPVLIVDVTRIDPRALEPLFDGARDIVIFNAAFDLSMLLAYAVDIDRIHATDLYLQELVLGASVGQFRRDGYYSLQAICARRLGWHLPKEQQLTNWVARPLSAEQLSYASRDASVLLELARSQHTDLEQAGLLPTARLEGRAVPAIAQLEIDGAPIDQLAWAERADAAERARLQLYQTLTRIAGTGGMPGEQGDFRFSTLNWDAAGQVLTCLQRRGHAGLTNTDAEILAGLVDTDALIRPLLDYREAARRSSSYGVEFLSQHLQAFDDRLHPRYRQMGATTGRMSAHEPSIQNVPRDPRYRACFRPVQDRCLVKVDYSQVELRLVADIAEDAELIKAFNANQDVHALSAALVLGVPLEEVTREHRQRAKAINFGLCYGMGQDTLRRHAWQNYAQRFTPNEAAAMRRQYFQAYRGVKRWHDQYRTAGGAEPVAIDTRTPSGRRRLGVSRFTEKLSSPVQGAGGDAIKGALALSWERRAQAPPGTRVVLCVHDELVAECDIAYAEAAAAWLTGCMRDSLQPLLRHVPAVAEATIGADWAGTPLSDTSKVAR
jgi:DNA polymerase-1